MNKNIEILTKNGIKEINEESLFIIAEVGNQFGGDFDKAMALCKAASEAGADAVKFIFWFPDEIMIDKGQTYSYATLDGPKVESMFDILNRLRLDFKQWEEIKMYCDRLGIIFMATVNSPSGIDWTENLELPILKLSTWDWNFMDLWTWAAKTGLPTIADMGAVTEEEVKRNVGWFQEERNSNLILMHCFHTNLPIQRNMRAIEFYDGLRGYSANDRNDDLDILAVGLGASALEKRLTLNRMSGVLHDAISQEPYEFQFYVAKMREMKVSLGQYGIHPSDNDLAERKKWFRRIVADCPIHKGETVLRPILEAVRGETGISPERIWDFVGKVATREIRRNDDIREEDFQ